MSDNTTHEEIAVPRSFLESANDAYSGHLLNVHHPAKSSGKVIQWRQKSWTCTGVLHSNGVAEVDLREVVPEDQYTGPPNDPKARGPDYYTGGRFTCKGKTWVLTNHRVTLVPDGTSELKQLNLF